MSLDRLVRAARLPMTEKVVLYALASRADSSGECYPSHARLAEDTGAGERTVRKALASLIARGALVRRGALGQANTYVLDASRLAALATPVETTAVAPTPARGAEVSTRTPAPRATPPAPRAALPRHHVPTTPAPRADEVPSKDPFEEPKEGIPSSAPPSKGASGVSSTTTKSPDGATENQIARPRRSSDVQRVFEHWVSAKRTFRPGGAQLVLSGSRRSKIQARLREGFTVSDLCAAIDGAFATPFNRGENRDGREWLDLELVCRDAAHVERFRDAAPSSAAAGSSRASEGTGVTTDHPARATVVHGPSEGTVPPPPEALAALRGLVDSAVPKFARSGDRPGAEVRWERQAS